jgi:protein-disulfide isomerase
MRSARGKLLVSEASSWVLVLCALVTTILVVGREFTQPSTGATERRRPSYVDEWQEALHVGLRLGSANAPVQIIEFADFQCPACAHFETTVRGVRDKYPTQVAFTLIHFPLPQHEFSEAAARVAECAHVQRVLEPMRTLLFERQRTFGSVPWTDFAIQAGVPDVKQFDVCVNDSRMLERIEQGKRMADRIGLRSTPTVIVNGWRLPLPPSADDIDKMIKNVMAGTSPVAGIDFL